MAKRKSTKGQTTINKSKDRVTRTPLTTGGGLRCSGRVSSSCSTSDTSRVHLARNPVISREREKESVYTSPISLSLRANHVLSSSFNF